MFIRKIDRYVRFYKGWFEIKFNGNISQDGVEFPTGNLKVPIEEQLRIVIK